MSKCFNVSITRNGSSELFCSECTENGIQEWTIKPRDTYLTLRFISSGITRYYIYLCLNCADKIYPDVKEKFDPALRFYV